MSFGEPAAKRQRKVVEEVPVTDDTWYLKIAVSDDVAASIIGKGGQAIKTMLSNYGGTARISHGGMYVPGTQLRAMFISGSLSVLPMLFSTVLEKHLEVHAKNGSDKAVVIKLICSKSAVSRLMGPGGQTAKELVAATGAKFSASDSATMERILTLFGEPDAIASLAFHVAQRINVDPNFRAAATQLDYGNSVAQPSVKEGGSHMGRGGLTSGPQAIQMQGTQSNAFVELPEEFMGALIGKGGATIQTLCQVSGAKISVMKEGNVLPGVTAPHRVVRISGAFPCVQKAHELVFKILSEGGAAPEPPMQQQYTNQYYAMGAY